MGDRLNFRGRRWPWRRRLPPGLQIPRELTGRRGSTTTLRGAVRGTGTWLVRLRPFMFGAVLVGIWPASDPALLGPPRLLSSAPETVSATFTHCRLAGGRTCVVDGDTFRIGSRRIRIIGIDTPEVDARCEQEALLARRATEQLLVSLNQGPFEMRGWAHNSRDRYGRELMALERIGPDGARTSIAEEMRASGVARRYSGGFRRGWC